MNILKIAGRFFVAVLTMAFFCGFAPQKPVVPTIVFDHSKHVTEMEVDCDTCHATQGTDRVLPDMQVCGSCHEEVSAQQDSQSCFKCHTSKTFEIVRTKDDPKVGWRELKVNHDKHGKEHGGISKQEVCASCHTNILKSTSSLDNNYPDSKICWSCHAKNSVSGVPSVYRP